MILKNILFLIAVVITLSGCSWFGGKDECEGDDCVPQLLDNAEAEQSWYCYGRTDESWDCVNSPDPDRIASIRPSAQEPFVMPQRARQPEPEPMRPPPSPPPVDRMQAVVPDDETLLSQPADFYTVQLIALKDEQGVIEYARSIGMLSPLYARIRNEGSYWYVLLLGVYPDQAAAQLAKDEWSRARILKVQPWVRRLGPLQQAIRLALTES